MLKNCMYFEHNLYYQHLICGIHVSFKHLYKWNLLFFPYSVYNCLPSCYSSSPGILAVSCRFTTHLITPTVTSLMRSIVVGTLSTLCLSAGYVFHFVWSFILMWVEKQMLTPTECLKQWLNWSKRKIKAVFSESFSITCVCCEISFTQTDLKKREITFLRINLWVMNYMQLVCLIWRGNWRVREGMKYARLRV